MIRVSVRSTFWSSQRNHGGEILSRVAGGETLTVTRDGDPVPELRALPKRPLQAERWSSASSCRRSPSRRPASASRARPAGCGPTSPTASSTSQSSLRRRQAAGPRSAPASSHGRRGQPVADGNWPGRPVRGGLRCRRRGPVAIRNLVQALRQQEQRIVSFRGLCQWRTDREPVRRVSAQDVDELLG